MSPNDNTVDETPLFGASILLQPPSTPARSHQSVADPSTNSTASTLSPYPTSTSTSPAFSSPNTTLHGEYDPTASPSPCSPFYNHARTRTSILQSKAESKVAFHIYEQPLQESTSGILSPQQSLQQLPSHSHPHDLEHGLVSTHSADHGEKEGSSDGVMWPCRSDQLKKDEARRRQRSRGCGPFASLTKRQRLWLQICIALLIVGAAVGLGVGIAKVTNTGVYKTANTNTPIGDGD